MADNLKTVAEVSRELKISNFTIKKWEKKKLLTKKKVWDERQQKKIRLYSDDDIKRLTWLKVMGGPNQSNEFYLKLLLEYIETGKIAPERLRWPVK